MDTPLEIIIIVIINERSPGIKIQLPTQIGFYE